MFEFGIFCVILLAVGYWATLFVLGRRADVLHGHFVEAEPQPEPAAVLPPMPSIAPRANVDALQSLLAVLKQDLMDASQR
jgi:hypothetical protein